MASLAAAALFGACAESESSQETCRVTADCSKDNNICYMGVCQHVDEERPCTTDSECLSGESCIANFCGTDTLTDTSMDTSMPPTDTSDPGDVTDIEDSMTVDTTPADTGEPDTLDVTAPEIVSITPAADTTDVALDSTVTITFSEPLIAATVNADNVFVNDPSNRRVPGAVTWDEATLTATLTFDAPLQPWTTYTLTVGSGVVDRAQISLVRVDSEFTTTAPASLANQEAIARAYAPVLYVDAADTRRDIPVAIDFDGDLRPVNNTGNIATTDAEPVVYWSFTSTETHDFVHYVLYFPTYKASSGAPEQDHAVTAVLVVVAHDDTDPLGTLQYFETYSVGYNPGRIDTWFPDCSAATTEPFCPLAFAGATVAVNRFHEIPAADYADADGRRPNVYVRHFGHDLCHWAYENTGAGFCGKTASMFSRDDNAVLQAAGEGEDGMVDFANSTGTYRLTHLATPWWINRDSVGPEDTNFYRDSALYTPSATALGGAGDQRVPTTLYTENVSSNTGLNAPWGFDTDDGFGLLRGAWFLDPARAASVRMQTLPDPFEYRANKYCYSLYFGLDRGDDALCQ